MQSPNALHIAIIPDGNRRWARRKGFSPEKGHEIAMKTVEKILQKSLKLKIPYITFWLASIDNLTKRSKKEVKFLIKVIGEEIERLLEDGRIQENKVKIRVLGRFRKIFPEKVVNLTEKLIKKTEKHDLFFLTILLAYDGTDEMLNAMKRIISFTKKRTIKVTKELIKDFLWTKDLPPVDLIIRTGCEGDPHNSAGFMMWDTRYSQYYFTKTLFPDLTSKEFEKAINNFLKRERRFGK